MAKIQIDIDKCERCGLCAMDCPACIFTQTGKKQIPTLEHTEFCIGCGHCAAVCPAGAVIHDGFPKGTIGPIDKSVWPSAEGLFELVRARRSLRNFLDKPVEPEIMAKIIAAANYAPTAHNVQSTRFVLVRDREKVRAIGRATEDYFRTVCRQLHNPLTRKMLSLVARREMEAAIAFLPELDMLLDGLRAGLDLILRNVPELLFFHARAGAMFAEVNANLALQNATLMCEGLGLGNFYLGFVVSACKRDKTIPKMLSIPPGNRVYGGLGIGYPKFTFRNWIDRRPPEVTIL